jgi:uncharacterized protein
MDAFATPEGSDWIRVSPSLIRMRHSLLTALVVPLAGMCILIALASTLSAAIIAIAGLMGIVWAWFAVGRNYRSWGYLEREDDLLVTHGAMFKKLTVVPYGRMQLVDVKAGPIERGFGLVRVKLHTAAATSDAQVCGLTPNDAGALRDRLTALGEAHAAGL